MSRTTIDLLMERHELWLSSRGKKGRQFFLVGADFRGVDVGGRNLSNAVIPEAVFSNMQLTDVDLSASNLAGADFSGSRLKNVMLVKANLDFCDLTGTTVIGGSWFRATCEDAKRGGLTFEGTDLDRTHPPLGAVRSGFERP